MDQQLIDVISRKLDEVVCLDEQLSLLSPFHHQLPKHQLIYFALFNYANSLKDSIEYYVNLDKEIYDILYAKTDLPF